MGMVSVAVVAIAISNHAHTTAAAKTIIRPTTTHTITDTHTHTCTTHTRKANMQSTRAHMHTRTHLHTRAHTCAHAHRSTHNTHMLAHVCTITLTPDPVPPPHNHETASHNTVSPTNPPPATILSLDLAPPATRRPHDTRRERFESKCCTERLDWWVC